MLKLTNTNTKILCIETYIGQQKLTIMLLRFIFVNFKHTFVIFRRGSVQRDSAKYLF